MCSRRKCRAGAGEEGSGLFDEFGDTGVIMEIRFVAVNRLAKAGTKNLTEQNLKFVQNLTARNVRIKTRTLHQTGSS